jgi:2-dehydropantoate 2-reductase
VKIIVYGAGVIGTLYAARLQEGGHRVTVVARGQRLADIRRYGLVLEDIVGHGRSTTRVDTIERVDPNDQYDIALISVRRDQVASVVPEFTTNHRIPILIFMLNNPTGTTDLAQALGRDRVLLGFPGAGGTRDGHVVRYAMIAQQPTTLGELGGDRAPARTGRNVSAVRISYDDVSRHGRVAKGARLLRDRRQRRNLHGWRRLSPIVRR